MCPLPSIIFKSLLSTYWTQYYGTTLSEEQGMPTDDYNAESGRVLASRDEQP